MRPKRREKHASTTHYTIYAVSCATYITKLIKSNGELDDQVVLIGWLEVHATLCFNFIYSSLMAASTPCCQRSHWLLHYSSDGAKQWQLCSIGGVREGERLIAISISVELVLVNAGIASVNSLSRLYRVHEEATDLLFSSTV